MAWGSSLTAGTIAEDATTSTANHAPVPTIFPFDATQYAPAANTEYFEALEQSAVNHKTKDEIEAERKEALLWDIASNRLVSETARVSALRLLHEIQLFKSGTAELMARIADLESKLLKKRSRKPAFVEE